MDKRELLKMSLEIPLKVDKNVIVCISYVNLSNYTFLLLIFC